PRRYPVNSIQCHLFKTKTLPDISREDVPEKSIFFHETSCSSDLSGKIVISSRQACSVESAAKLNPNFGVYLLYLSPGTLKFEGSESDRFLQALLTYRNVKIRHLDFETYVENSPVERLFKEGKIERSEYAISHVSDVLRYLTLWKYGGIYLDLDLVVIKSLEKLPFNYAGAESTSFVAAGVVSFTQKGMGHHLATLCLKDLEFNFNGKKWGNNGPGVITRLSRFICATNNTEEMTKKKCLGDFRVYPSETFYPVIYQDWSMYFDVYSVKKAKNLTKNSYVVHVWNKLSSKKKVPVNVEVPYTFFARKYCPKVFRECEENF
ncbi:lactosylceramide 4-alpha-galactosyltransferase, partial [Asbolus verrucosus]